MNVFQIDIYVLFYNLFWSNMGKSDMKYMYFLFGPFIIVN